MNPRKPCHGSGQEVTLLIHVQRAEGVEATNLVDQVEQRHKTILQKRLRCGDNTVDILGGYCKEL